MNWSTMVKVAHFHLADRASYTALPWVVHAVNFAIYLAGAANAGGGAQIGSVNVAAIHLFFLVVSVSCLWWVR
jgi:hypothetical protein